MQINLTFYRKIIKRSISAVFNALIMVSLFALVFLELLRSQFLHSKKIQLFETLHCWSTYSKIISSNDHFGTVFFFLSYLEITGSVTYSWALCSFHFFDQTLAQQYQKKIITFLELVFLHPAVARIVSEFLWAQLEVLLLSWAAPISCV